MVHQKHCILMHHVDSSLSTTALKDHFQRRMNYLKHFLFIQVFCSPLSDQCYYYLLGFLVNHQE